MTVNPWTEEEMKAYDKRYLNSVYKDRYKPLWKMYQLYKKGKSAVEIGAVLGCAAGTVATKLRMAGYEIKYSRQEERRHHDKRPD